MRVTNEEAGIVKILTTVKRVNNPDAKPRISGDGSELVMDGIEQKLNDFDEYGVEEAIRLKEELGAEVIVACVGSSEATKEIRTALAMGGDRGILVEADDADLDPGGVAQILAALVAKEEPDLIVFGKLAVDTENNQVAQRLAALLDWPQATFAYEVGVEDGWVKVGREVDGGTSTLRFQMPGIVTADLRLNEPRYASLPGIMKARSKQLDTYTPDDLGVELEPQLTTVGYEMPPSREAGEILEDIDELVDRLQNEAKVL